MKKGFKIGFGYVIGMFTAYLSILGTLVFINKIQDKQDDDIMEDILPVTKKKNKNKKKEEK